MARTNPVMAVFGEEHVQRLTGLSKRQLRYWRDTGFFRPSAPAAAYGRYYAFRDVVGLRTIAELLKQHQVSLRHLRKVAEKLDHLRDDLWTKTILYVNPSTRRVAFPDPGTKRPADVLTGQYQLAIPLKRVRAEAKADAEKLLRRSGDAAGKIVTMLGGGSREAVFAGTRIPVVAILRFSEAGFTPEQIVAEYPDLTIADVEAALRRAEHDRTDAAA